MKAFFLRGRVLLCYRTSTVSENSRPPNLETNYYVQFGGHSLVDFRVRRHWYCMFVILEVSSHCLCLDSFCSCSNQVECKKLQRHIKTQGKLSVSLQEVLTKKSLGWCRNLEKLPLSAHLAIRIAAEQKLRETSRHHQSIATILPVSGKLTLNTGTQQLSGTVRPIAAHGLPSRKDNSSGNFAISITSDSRRDSNSQTTSRTKPFEDKKGERLKSTTPVANTTHNSRRQSVSSKPPWGKAPPQVGKALRQTPKLGIEKKRDSVTSPTSGLSDDRRQENIMSKAMVIKGRTKSTSNRPPWGKATLQPNKVSCEVRISQSRLPAMPFRDLSNHFI